MLVGLPGGAFCESAGATESNVTTHAAKANLFIETSKYHPGSCASNPSMRAIVPKCIAAGRRRDEARLRLNEVGKSVKKGPAEAGHLWLSDEESAYQLWALYQSSTSFRT